MGSAGPFEKDAEKYRASPKIWFTNRIWPAARGSQAQFALMKGIDFRSRGSFHPPCGLDLDELGVGMGDDGGEHDTADND